MTTEQSEWLKMAKERLEVGKHTLESRENFARWAVSDAYYSMFYCANALLLDKGQSYKSHGQLIGAFGREFAATDVLPRELHRYLIDASELRTKSDYDLHPDIVSEEATEQLQRAAEFITQTEAYLSK